MLQNKSFLQRCKNISTLCLATLISLTTLNSAYAGQTSQSQAMRLKSCKIEIQADRIYTLPGATEYHGNVQFLYGLANVRMDRVRLIKNKDGSCKLVANLWQISSNDH